MITRAQKIRLAIFLIVSAVLLLALLAVVAGMKFMEERDEYFIEYADVSVGGLEVSTQVKYHGIKVGRVEDVYVDPEDITKIVVRISLRKGTPVKTDTRAVVAGIGITGLKYIELSGGTRQAQEVNPGGKILPGPSFAEETEQILDKLDRTLGNLVELTAEDTRTILRSTLTSVDSLLVHVIDLVEANKDQIRTTSQNVAKVSGDLIRISAKAEDSVDRMHQIVHSEEIERSLENLHEITSTLKSDLGDQQLGRTLKALNELIANADRTFTHLDLTLLKSRSDIIRSFEELRESLENLREATAAVREDPSVLLRRSSREELGE